MKSKRSLIVTLIIALIVSAGVAAVHAAGGDRLGGVRSDLNEQMKVFIPTDGLKVEVKEGETVKWTLSVNASTPTQLDIAAAEGTSQKDMFYPIVAIVVTDNMHFKVFTTYTMTNYLLNSGGATKQDSGNIGADQDKVFLKTVNTDTASCMLMIEPAVSPAGVSAKLTSNVVTTGNYGQDTNCQGDQSKWFTQEEAAAVREIGALFFDASLGVKPPLVDEATPEATPAA